MSDVTIQKTAFDTYFSGGVNAQGKIKEVYSKEAISNAFKIWITSKRGDVLRQPNKGGYLYPWLAKPMSDDNAEMIATMIKSGIENDFDPYLILQSLEVIADYEKRAWIINLQAYSPTYKVSVDISERIKSIYYN